MQAHPELELRCLQGFTMRQWQALQPKMRSGLNLVAVDNLNQIWVAGQNADLEKLTAGLVKDKLAKVKMQDLAYGIYSEFMLPVVEQFAPYLEKVDFKNLQIPVLSNINGRALKTGRIVKKELTAQLLQPLNWPKVAQGLSDCDVIVEVGPGRALMQSLQMLYPQKLVLELNYESDIFLIKEAMGLILQDQTHENQ